VQTKRLLVKYTPHKKRFWVTLRKIWLLSSYAVEHKEHSNVITYKPETSWKDWQLLSIGKQGPTLQLVLLLNKPRPTYRQAKWNITQGISHHHDTCGDKMQNSCMEVFFCSDGTHGFQHRCVRFICYPTMGSKCDQRWTFDAYSSPVRRTILPDPE